MKYRKLLIAIALTVLLVLMAYGLRKTINMLTGPPYNVDDARTGIKYIRSTYGQQMAETVEKMYRLETNHFTSKQYEKTGTGGMEKGKWKNIPQLSYDINSLPTVPMNDADLSDGIDNFIIFPSVKDAMIYKAEYIKRYGGNAARWYSLDAASQARYTASLSGIKATIANSLA